MKSDGPAADCVRKAQERISSCADRLMDVTKRTDTLCASLSKQGQEGQREASELLIRILKRDLSDIETDLSAAVRVCRDKLSGPLPPGLQDSVHCSLLTGEQILAICNNRIQWLDGLLTEIRHTGESADHAESISRQAQIESFRAGLRRYSAVVRQSPDGR